MLFVFNAFCLANVFSGAVEILKGFCPSFQFSRIVFLATVRAVSVM